MKQINDEVTPDWQKELNKHSRVLSGWLTDKHLLFNSVPIKDESTDWDLIKFIEDNFELKENVFAVIKKKKL